MFGSLPFWGGASSSALWCSLRVPAFFSETMRSDLPFTNVLDVLKFPAASSRVYISSAIVHRFTAYKVNAVQFVCIFARVTFSSASDRDAVMRFESVSIGDVDCVVRGGGPRAQKVLFFSTVTP